MAQHQVRRLPVVDDENRLVGVASQADIALEAKDKSVGEMVAEISKPPQEARQLHLDENGEGFDFLGFHHRMVESERKPGRWFLARFPSAQATRAARARIREITDRRRLWLPPEEIVAPTRAFALNARSLPM